MNNGPIVISIDRIREIKYHVKMGFDLNEVVSWFNEWPEQVKNEDFRIVREGTEESKDD